jgi:hypothetical protein
MFCNIPGSGFGFLRHNKLLEFSRQFECCFDISVLSPLIAAGEQDYERLPALNKIDSVSRAIVDAQLRDSFSHRFDVAGVAQRQATDACIGASPRLPIPQALKPCGIFIGLPDCNYRLIVSYGIQKDKKNLWIIQMTFPLKQRRLTQSSAARAGPSLKTKSHSSGSAAMMGYALFR